MIWSDVLVQWYDTRRVEAILEAPTNPRKEKGRKKKLRKGRGWRERKKGERKGHTSMPAFFLLPTTGRTNFRTFPSHYSRHTSCNRRSFTKVRCKNVFKHKSGKHSANIDAKRIETSVSIHTWFTLWFTLCSPTSRSTNQRGLGLSGLVHEEAHPTVPNTC